MLSARWIQERFTSSCGRNAIIRTEPSVSLPSKMYQVGHPEVSGSLETQRALPSVGSLGNRQAPKGEATCGDGAVRHRGSTGIAIFGIAATMSAFEGAFGVAGSVQPLSSVPTSGGVVGHASRP